MVDLALGTPELGAVNFNVLHSLLHAVLLKLDIGNVKADMPEESGDLKAGVDLRPGQLKELDEARREESDLISDADSGVAYSAVGARKPGSPPMSGIIPITRTPYHQLEEKVERLERKWAELNSLPSNSELIERTAGLAKEEQNGGEKPRPIADMWQAMQLSRKVDANTQGVSKVGFNILVN